MNLQKASSWHGSSYLLWAEHRAGPMGHIMANLCKSDKILVFPPLWWSWGIAALGGSRTLPVVSLEVAKLECKALPTKLGCPLLRMATGRPFSLLPQFPLEERQRGKIRGHPESHSLAWGACQGEKCGTWWSEPNSRRPWMSVCSYLPREAVIYLSMNLALPT